MIKEFIEDIDKLLTFRQENTIKSISDFSDEEKKELKIFAEFMSDIKKNSDRSKEITDTTDTITKSKSSKITLTVSRKVGESILGCLNPTKQKTFLAEMTLVYLISYQEAFIKDYVKEILIAKRDILKSKKTTLTFEEICAFNSMDSLIEHMAQEEVDKILYESIDKQADYIEKQFGLSLPSEFGDWNIVREASYRRNLIIHNHGITNKIYCSKTGYQKTNTRLKTDSDYVQNATNAVLSFIDFIHSKICEIVGLPKPKLMKNSSPSDK